MTTNDATRADDAVRPSQRFWARVSEVLGAPLVLVTPFVIFVTYHEYRLLSSEVLWVLPIFVSVGLLASAVMRLGGTAARVLISAGLLTFYVEVQLDWLTPRMIAATYLGLVSVCWLLRTRVSEIMAGFSVATLALTLVFPGSTRIGETKLAEEETTPAEAVLPPLLHVVLDEHIGVAGIPTDIPSGAALKKALAEFYQGYGFRVFGGAFSQYVDTSNSISNLLNLTSKTRDNAYFGRQAGTYDLRENAYFRLLSERGYRLRVYHSDFMRLCEAEDVQIVSCLQYPSTSIKSIEDLPLGTAQKTLFILRSFLGRSTTLDNLRRRYQRTLRPWLLNGGFDPSVWPSDPRVGPIAVSPVIDRLREDITESPRGTAFFAHLLTPHYPYVYDADCRLRLDVSEWLSASSPEVARPRVNTPATRAGALRALLRTGHLCDEAAREALRRDEGSGSVRQCNDHRAR